MTNKQATNLRNGDEVFIRELNDHAKVIKVNVYDGLKVVSLDVQSNHHGFITVFADEID